jgi:hypothetical protein
MEWLAIIAVILVVGFAVLTEVLRKLGVKLPATAISWQSFLRGQGTILLFFLLLGMALGWLSLKYLGVESSQTTDQIRLVEYRQLDLSAQSVHEELDTHDYTHVTVYAKSDAPQASTMSVQVIPQQTPDQAQGSVEIQGTDSAWTRLDEPVSSKRLILIIESPGTLGARATSADVLVFLSRK